MCEIILKKQKNPEFSRCYFESYFLSNQVQSKPDYDFKYGQSKSQAT